MQQTLIEWLSGPNGGLIAIGMMLGGAAVWAMNMKIVSPFVQRAHAAEIAAYEAKLKGLEVRVADLEATVREYHDILKRRAALLGPESERE